MPQDNSNMKRCLVIVDPDTHADFKAACVKARQSMSNILQTFMYYCANGIVDINEFTPESAKKYKDKAEE